MTRTLQHESASVTLYEDAYSRRIRVDDYAGSPEKIVPIVDAALPDWTEKLIIKSRPDDVSHFESLGFRKEAFIAGYFAGVDMHFVCRYLNAERGVSMREADEAAILRSVLLLPQQSTPFATPNIEYAKAADAAGLADLYKTSFRIYPTPVNDPVYLRKTMEDGTVYVCIRDGNRIVSAASAEINLKYKNAELTDCASAEGYNGRGYMRGLLTELENHLLHQGFTCSYTIARSASFGMNKVFHQLGYTYGGRMTKNCMIFSGMEDMNVWYKYSTEASSG